VDELPAYEKKIPRMVSIPERLRSEALRYRKAVATEFIFDYKHYTIVLATDNPDVNFQDEVCYLGNLLYLGFEPPEDEMILEIKQPTGWKRLADRYYVTSLDEFNERWGKSKRMLRQKDMHRKRLRL